MCTDIEDNLKKILGRFTLVRSIYWTLRLQLKPLFMRGKGISIVQTPHGRLILDLSDAYSFAVYKQLKKKQIYEGEVTKILLAHSQSFECFVDVGANVGYFTILAAKNVRSAGEVYAFEPNPIAFRWLLKNIELNGLHNVHLFREAAFDVEGHINLYVPKGDISLANTSVPLTKASLHFVVDTIPIDLIFEGKTPDMVKIDVEGDEYKVIRGMKSLVVRSSKLHVILEENEYNYESQKIIREQMYSFLNEWFDIYQIIGFNGGLKLVGPIKNPVIKGRVRHLLCIKKGYICNICELLKESRN